MTEGWFMYGRSGIVNYFLPVTFDLDNFSFRSISSYKSSSTVAVSI